MDPTEDLADLLLSLLGGDLALLGEFADLPLVTFAASSRPAWTSAWSMSLSTTGMPAAAMVWAIWPPIVPAPTTAALNTNMLGSPLLTGGREPSGAGIAPHLPGSPRVGL